MNRRAVSGSALWVLLLGLSACSENPPEQVRKPEPARGPLLVERSRLADGIMADATGAARRTAKEVTPGKGNAFLCVDIKVVESGAVPPTIDLGSLKATVESSGYPFVAFGLGQKRCESEIPNVSHVLDASGNQILWSELFSLQGEAIIRGNVARLGKTEAFALVFEVPAKTASFSVVGVGRTPLAVGQAEYYSVTPAPIKGQKLPATLGPGVIITAHGNLLATSAITRSAFRGWVADIQGSPEMLTKLHAGQFDSQLDLEVAEDRARFIRQVVGILGKEDASRARVRILIDRDRKFYGWPEPASAPSR